ncbi:MAG: 3'-5' exonuclease [Bacteroidales bacterium]|nr:3'-5' exonuclease [Bacteroidales bacterium]MDD6722360.1 3'-5' exonuclease [Bacteroidales bacterium]
MKLKLNRPLVFFDLETTGVNLTADRIVEISTVKLMPDGTIEERTRRINPEMHIPEAATAVHHIKDEDVRNEPTFKQVAKSLARMLEGCDLAGFNSNRFDIPMLDQEFQRANVDFDFSKARFVDVQTIFHKREPRNLVAAYKFYCDKDLEGAHSANADTKATYEVLLAQLDRYEDLPTDIDGLSNYSSQNRNVDFTGRLVYDDKKREIINFGKYKGRVAEEVLAQDPGYYGWIMQGDFTKNTKDCFTRIRMRLKK